MQDGSVCHNMGITSFKNQRSRHSVRELDRAGVDQAMAPLKG